MSKKRYSLPEGKAYRPFGSPDVITNDNITDAIVTALLKENPGLKKVFIDSEAPEAAETTSTPAPDSLEALTKKQLHAKYSELTGKVADEKLNKEALVALVKAEIDAKALLG